MTPTSEPLMTVVLASYTGASGVEACLNALSRQSVRERLEIIVVDDGSSDGTADVAERHQVTVIRHPQNRGQSAARNTGITASRSPLIAFLDDDCLPTPTWAETIIDGYTSRDLLGVGGDVRVLAATGVIGAYTRRYNPIRAVVSGGSRRARLRAAAGPPPDLTTTIEAWALVGANMSFRRECLMH